MLKVLQLLGDITKKEVCEELVDKTLTHFGELDVLVRLKQPQHLNIRNKYQGSFPIDYIQPWS